MVRPVNTADRAIGSDLNRSITPLLQVVGEADPVVSAPNTTVCTKIPGMRKFT